MKIEKIMRIAFIFFIGVWIYLAFNHHIGDKCVIDLPEEYMVISTNPYSPDTMLSHVSGDTIHFYFKPR